MKIKIGSLWVMLIVIALPLQARMSLSAAGGVLYPGLEKSPNFESRFIAGPGYEFSMQHDLFTISEGWPVRARYAIQNYNADISLPFVETANFKFNYFSIQLFTDLGMFSSLDWYAGAGAALLNVSASKDFTDIDETIILPQFLLGARYALGADFAVYGEGKFQVGTFDSGNDTIPLSGLGFSLGLSMYISD